MAREASERVELPKKVQDQCDAAVRRNLKAITRLAVSSELDTRQKVRAAMDVLLDDPAFARLLAGARPTASDTKIIPALMAGLAIYEVALAIYTIANAKKR